MTTTRLLRILFLLGLAALASLALRAQQSAGATKESILRPPAGHKIALVEFADLECPDCARAAPLLEDAVKTYKIPLVIYDFPLPMHQWAMQAAEFARYFRTKSSKANDLETAYRLYIYQNQSQITPENLRTFTEKFAQQHKVDLPFVIDPQGKIAAAIKADKDKGQQVGIEHTPTIYVVTAARTGKPFVEVVDRSQLFALIDEMQQEVQVSQK